MVYIIITSRNLFWVILSLISHLIMLAALLNPKWLIGPQQVSVDKNSKYVYEPSVGVYTKCGRPTGREFLETESCTTIAVNGFATDSIVYPNIWKASAFFLLFGLSIMAVSVLLAILSFCIQSICKKSIYNIIGTIQALAGIFYILALVLYPMGWSSERVKKLCGNGAAIYEIGNCSLGSGAWEVIFGTILTLICASLSVWADKSINSSKVERYINEGHSCICVF